MFTVPAIRRTAWETLKVNELNLDIAMIWSAKFGKEPEVYAFGKKVIVPLGTMGEWQHVWEMK